jgi:hypothetical protein
MSGFAIALGFSLLANPELPKDVFQGPSRGFLIPFVVDKDKDKVEKIRLFVSVDLGKTWKRVMDCKPDDNHFKFTADRDFQQYWFAVQHYHKSGKVDPAETKGLEPALKVYVNPLRNDAKAKRVPEK